VKLNVATVTAWLLGILLIIAPSNLFLVLCDSCGYVNGLRSDYLIPRLYVSDLILIALLLINWKSLISLVKTGSASTKKAALILLVIIAFAIRQFLSPHSSTAIWNFFQILLLSGVGWLLLTKQCISKNIWLGGLSVALLLQTVVGWYQFWQQKPLLPYYFLGETAINHSIGIPQEEYPFLELGNKVIPHGTTAHPNVLAGFIGIYSVLLISFILKTKLSKSSSLFFSLTIASSWSLLFLIRSFSGAALLTTGGIILLGSNYFRFRQQKWLAPTLVVAIFISGFLLSYLPTIDTSISRRQYLLQSSADYVKQHFSHMLLGAGISNFTAISEQFSPNTEIVRFNQPVHNVGWLFLAENGLAGILVLTLLIFHRGKTNSFTKALVLLFPILIWDHYLLSIQPGRELFLITFMGLMMAKELPTD
jgi:hypothetical protein